MSRLQHVFWPSPAESEPPGLRDSYESLCPVHYETETLEVIETPSICWRVPIATISWRQKCYHRDMKTRLIDVNCTVLIDLEPSNAHDTLRCAKLSIDDAGRWLTRYDTSWPAAEIASQNCGLHTIATTCYDYHSNSTYTAYAATWEGCVGTPDA